METLRNEAFLLSQCVYHPNVVRCYSSFRKGDDFFIVMEYVGHSSLNDISLPLGNQRQVVSLVIQLAMGIKHLKNNKIIHRDIKPSNILISDKGILKIADFGISKQLNETALARTCLGTPFYAAPEIIEKQYALPNHRHYDYSVDIWSFGVLLYECIHGYLPFVGNDLSELRKKIRYVSPDIREDIHEDLKIILKGCLTKHPQNRMSIEQILSIFWPSLDVPLVRKQMKEDIRRFIPYF